MAFLHCHNCNWSQDDFWDFSFGRYGYFKIFKNFYWKYNPISCFLSYVSFYLKPHFIEFDISLKEERGWKSNRRHSWICIWDEFKRMLLDFWKQEWWFYNSIKEFYKRKELPCPNCGSNDLDID